MKLNSERICNDCGAPIPESAPGCVACLLAIAQSSSHQTVISPSASKLPAATPLGREMGDYELLEEIGRGGMGVVFKARQNSLNRIVALKLILAGEFASETTVARFREEAELVASLQHPNIVPIYEIGESGGWHFYSMKLIEGDTLASLIHGRSRHEEAQTSSSAGVPDNDQIVVTASPTISGFAPINPTTHPSDPPLDLRTAVSIISQVCRGVHFAHQSGIIHRDLSPENILVDRSGNPWVTDFGMARFLNTDRRLTVTRAIVGKPDYMSPEQAAARTGHLTTASDIFSLGATLYHACTGFRPFGAETSLATLDRIRNDNPRSTRTLNPEIDRDLETIVLKCLSKSPGDRYSSADALAEDLERWLRGEPIAARPIHSLERTWKWVRRKPLKAALIAVAILAFMGPLLVTFFFYHFLLPYHSRSHFLVSVDASISGFNLYLERNNPTRATPNFDMFQFDQPLRVTIYFTNIPPQHLSLITNLQFQICADVPGAPDPPRSPVLRAGEVCTVEARQWRDRAYYVAPVGGWRTDPIFAAAPEARICIILLEPIAHPKKYWWRYKPDETRH